MRCGGSFGKGAYKMTNEELVELIQSGENVTDNMEQLYNQNHGMIYKMARRYTWGHPWKI